MATPTVHTVAKTEAPDVTVWTLEVAHLDPFVPPQRWIVVATPDPANDLLIDPQAEHHDFYFTAPEVAEVAQLIEAHLSEEV